MIFLYTDFGLDGPYVGQMKAVLAKAAPAVPVIDLMHDAPRYAPDAAAYLLAALVPRLSAGDILLGVVDPGVGDARRRPVAVDCDGIWLVGPDNGLFAVSAALCKAAQWYEIIWRPALLSHSFHGRDLFAPIAGRLAAGRSWQDRLRPLTGTPPVGADWPDQAARVIYFDGFGNAMTGLRGDRLSDSAVVAIAGHRFHRAETFSDAPRGSGFWYRNALGLVEVAVNQGSAKEALGLKSGMAVEFEGI